MSTAPETAFAEASVAEAFLRSLRAHGIETVFANAGTDFAPIIERCSAWRRAARCGARELR